MLWKHLLLPAVAFAFHDSPGSIIARYDPSSLLEVMKSTTSARQKPRALRSTLVILKHAF
jgi:ABC-type dipeptide/oligopeptide/nickel transport system permease component